MFGFLKCIDEGSDDIHVAQDADGFVIFDHRQYVQTMPVMILAA